MSRFSFHALLYGVLLVTALGMAQNTPFKKFVGPGNRYSFYYPADWNVVPSQNIVDLRHPSTGEEITLAFSSGYESREPLEYAANMLRMLQTVNPNLRTSNPVGDQRVATVDFKAQIDQGVISGVVLAIKSTWLMRWATYSTQQSFDRQQGLALLKQVTFTLVTNPNAPAPAIRATASDLLGTWATEAPRGSVGSPTAGYHGPAYLVETYWFHPDGTYAHQLIGAGGMRQGKTLTEGRYTVEGNLLILRAQSESSDGGFQKPVGFVSRLWWSLEDAQTLRLYNADSGHDPYDPANPDMILYRFRGEQH